MKKELKIKKVLNNNVVIAQNFFRKESVLIDKGIGFGKKVGDPIDASVVEKIFILQDKKEQEQYKKLLPFLDEEFIGLMNDIVYFIQSKLENEVGEHIHIALSDHIAFAMKRIKEGLELQNPFLLETKTLYPEEYRIATDVVKMINEQSKVTLPEAEIGFIALHIHSATSSKSISEVSHHSRLIHELITVIEKGLSITIDKEKIDYLRLVRHLTFTIERAKTEEKVDQSKKLLDVVQEEYPLCYSVALKVINVIQQGIKTPVDESEAVYLTLHLQRLSNKNK
ncbi:glucose PTS transporter transcription antiterminator GlcT [Bacillus sp. FJAT-45350]|uniref:glucose PTS transporter transcription antiterminator GlcT n=1 Tax=Bacillus sp. FJAT-45350 TaxID=2011014 RepID=UPI000BB71C56|nr:PRD domain-containing protein [Bacillus sp. FJAT-45350]